MRHAANIITGLRILCSLLLLPVPVFSPQFYLLYLLCGLSDMADGAVARRTNSSTPFGAKLDTAADLVFVAAAFIKLLPVLPLPSWAWGWAGIIALIKAASIARNFHRFLTSHTFLNKVTGFLLFLLPLTLRLIDLKYSAAVVCAAATAAAIQEGCSIKKRV